MNNPVIKNFGFTVIEVLAVISILVIGLLGVSSLVVQNIQAQSINRNYLTASMLAQEGLDLVRNARDTNWLQQDDWLGQSSGIDIVGDGTYAIAYDGDIFFTPSSINGARLLRNAQGYYDHNFIAAVGQQTKFYRLITVVNNVSSLNVESHVQWTERGRTHDYKANTILYDWR